MVQFKVLNEQEYQSYWNDGYIAVPDLVLKRLLEQLKYGLSKLVDKSREIEHSDGIYDIESGHSKDSPRLRRITFLDDLDPVFWEFAADSVVIDLAEDLFGSDITFRECIINFKWRDGGQEVKWHQDIPFYPHTNMSSAQLLIFLDDVEIEQGPLQVLPGSHKGKVFEHYDESGKWLGYIPDNQLHGNSTGYRKGNYRKSRAGD